MATKSIVRNIRLARREYHNFLVKPPSLGQEEHQVEGAKLGNTGIRPTIFG